MIPREDNIKEHGFKNHKHCENAYQVMRSLTVM